MKHPDRKECYEFLNQYGTPVHVVGHCKAVAAVAYVLGRALNHVGGTKALPMKYIRIETDTIIEESDRMFYRQAADCPPGDSWRLFNLDMVLAAGLLHDMARTDDRHWDVGADFCRSKGLEDEEKAIRAHMHYEFTNDADHLTEIDLLCFGDRLSLEDRYAGLDKRMDYIVRKAERNGNPGAKPRILAKKEKTRKLIQQVEKRLGCTLDQIMDGIDYENTETK